MRRYGRAAPRPENNRAVETITGAEKVADANIAKTHLPLANRRAACLYLPNGNPAPGPKFDYKLRWFDRLLSHAADLLALNQPVVLAGDFNVMPTDLDVYAPERWVDDALFRPEVRDAYHRLLAQGWLDALRTLHPGERIYTFWKFFRNAYARNAGLRIDHLLLSPALAPRLVAAAVDREVRGWEKASDHAPAWIELATPAADLRPGGT
jgi:exodeoxyribonuclease-3